MKGIKVDITSKLCFTIYDKLNQQKRIGAKHAQTFALRHLVLQSEFP